MKSINYEVLRRNDGVIALSANAGQIEFESKNLRRVGKDLIIEGVQGGQQAVKLEDVPEDVLEFLDKNGSIFFFEFAFSRLFREHHLSLTKNP